MTSEHSGAAANSAAGTGHRTDCSFKVLMGRPGQPSTGPVRRRRRDERPLESAGRLVGLEPVVLPLLARRLPLGRATGSTGPPRSTMTVSRESGRGLAAVSRERVPWKEPLQDTTRLYAHLAFTDPEKSVRERKTIVPVLGRSTSRQTGALARGRPLTVYT